MMVGKLPAGPLSGTNDSVKKKKKRACLKELKCKLSEFKEKEHGDFDLH